MENWFNKHLVILMILAVLLVAIIIFAIIKAKLKKSIASKNTINEDSVTKPVEKRANDVSSKDPNARAIKFLELIGGKDNVESFTSCKTRLKINLKDENMASYENEDYINTHAAGIIKRSENSIDIIVGFDVDNVAHEFGKLL